jgi:hypothetical protein
VGPRAVLNAVVKRKIPSPHRVSNPRTPIVQPVAQRYTEWATRLLHPDSIPPKNTYNKKPTRNSFTQPSVKKANYKAFLRNIKFLECREEGTVATCGWPYRQGRCDTLLLQCGKKKVTQAEVVARLWAGRPGFGSGQGLGFFSLRHRVQTGSGAHPTFYLMDTEVSSPGIKLPGREADCSLPSSA